MELYVPSLISASAAFVIILICFILRPPIIFIGIISIIALVLAAYIHITMYQIEYRNFIFETTIQSHITWILIFAMIIFGFGFILLIPKGSSVKNLLQPASIFSTATIDRYARKQPTEPSILDYWFGDTPQQPRIQDRQYGYDNYANSDKNIRKLLGSV
jgi:hypothetical protein